jgi:type IV pilus assembly protein PilZ
MSSDSDRRRDGRAPIELRVEYKRLNTFFADYTKNISRGGTFIGTERPLDIGTEFVFALALPTLAEPIRLRGRVMWVTTVAEASKANPPGMGIEFRYASAEERQDMEKLVEDLIASQLGDRLAARLLGKE